MDATKIIKAYEIEQGMELVERDGSVLTVDSVTDCNLRGVNFIVLELHSLNQAGIRAAIRPHSPVRCLRGQEAR